MLPWRPGSKVRVKSRDGHNLIIAAMAGPLEGRDDDRGTPTSPSRWRRSGHARSMGRRGGADDPPPVPTPAAETGARPDSHRRGATPTPPAGARILPGDRRPTPDPPAIRNPNPNRNPPRPERPQSRSRSWRP